LCCRTIYAKLLVSAVYANQQVLNAVEVTVDSFVPVRVASIMKSSDVM
jgi:hypothetical protein